MHPALYLTYTHPILYYPTYTYAIPYTYTLSQPILYTHPIYTLYAISYINSITAHLKFQQSLGPNVTTTLIPDSAVGRCTTNT